MSLSRLAKGCRECPYVDTCDHKRIEAIGYLQNADQSNAADMAASVLRETIDIHIGDTVLTRDKDEIEKELYKSLYSCLYDGLQMGG